jgi:hypothetical protein
MIQVMRIPMVKTKLAALWKDERVLLFLLGYVSNQTMMLEKLILFSGNRDPKEVLDAHATGIQQQMLLRLMIGALNEAWRVPGCCESRQYHRSGDLAGAVAVQLGAIR